MIGNFDEKINLSDFNIGVKDLSPSQRPREILFDRGIDALSDAQLVALLLGSGTREVSAINLGQKIIDHFGGIENLMATDLKSLMGIKGVGISKASRIIAGLELGSRASREKSKKEKVSITTPDDVVEIFYRQLDLECVEVFKCIMLDVKNQIISSEDITRGLVNMTIISPREVFKSALSRLASKIIVLHNHPSGDSFPSHEDEMITKKLLSAGQILDIPLVDHIVYGSRDNYYSFRAEGKI